MELKANVYHQAELAMSSPSASSSDNAFGSLSMRFRATRTSQPTLDSVEQLMQLQAAVQGQVSTQLTSLATAIEKDLSIAGKCVASHSKPSKPRNSLLVNLQVAVDEQQGANDKAETLKADGERLRTRFIEVKRQISVVQDHVLRERQLIAEKHKVLVKVDRLLSDASRLLLKVDNGNQQSVQAKGSRTARDSGVQLRLEEEV